MSSTLNPEAPEFYPPVVVMAMPQVEEGFKIISKATLSSNRLPMGASRETFKTFTDFNVITYKLSENVVIQSNTILCSEKLPCLNNSNDDEQNFEKIVEANDVILDRVNTLMDVTLGLSKPPQAGIVGPMNTSTYLPAWNNPPVVTKIETGSAVMIGAKNIARPQVHFKDKIDNSDRLWVPKICDKPNSIKPLALTIEYDHDGEAVGYEHPYRMELDKYTPPARLLEGGSESPAPPAPLAATPLTLVETEPQLSALLEHLRHVTEFAVDLEHHSYRTYQGITCLIQLSTDEGGDFIIDAIALREHLHRLNQPFTDPKILKVFHGADLDVVWLQRDFGVYVVGMFDTHHAARSLQLTGLSLKHLLNLYCQVDTDKRHQLADWRMRPLPEELVQYARVDTHYLLYIWRRMRGELLARGGGGDALLRAVFTASCDVCGRTYRKEVCHDESHMALYVRSRKHFNSQQMGALRLLYRWRDQQARELDESTAYLLPNHMLLTLAEILPREVQGVTACCNPMPPFVKQNLLAIHRIIISCRELPLEPALFRMPAGISAALSHERSEHRDLYAFHDLTNLPDFREDLPVAMRSDHPAGGADSIGDHVTIPPDIQLFNRTTTTDCVSKLNADAKTFIPPFERYRSYRSLAQIEEIKEYKQKEAKIAALSKGDPLIQKEVLSKVQVLLEKQEESTASTSQALRKRKLMAEVKQIEPTTSGKQQKRKDNAQKGNPPKTKYDYQNANYNKLYDNSEKFKNKYTHQYKNKFKKLKK